MFMGAVTGEITRLTLCDRSEEKYRGVIAGRKYPSSRQHSELFLCYDISYGFVVLHSNVEVVDTFPALIGGGRSCFKGHLLP